MLGPRFLPPLPTSFQLGCLLVYCLFAFREMPTHFSGTTFPSCLDNGSWKIWPRRCWKGKSTISFMLSVSLSFFSSPFFLLSPAPPHLCLQGHFPAGMKCCPLQWFSISFKIANSVKEPCPCLWLVPWSVCGVHPLGPRNAPSFWWWLLSS